MENMKRKQEFQEDDDTHQQGGGEKCKFFTREEIDYVSRMTGMSWKESIQLLKCHGSPFKAIVSRLF
jgi:hypothetical protein